MENDGILLSAIFDKNSVKTESRGKIVVWIDFTKYLGMNKDFEFFHNVVHSLQCGNFTVFLSDIFFT